MGIAGLAAFVMLVWGGVEWLLSGAIPARASEARDRVRNAILGLLLVLASFLIIQIINPELTAGLGRNLEVKCSELSPGACDPLLGSFPDGSTTARLPAGATKDGVYLCRDEGCVCRDENNCNQGADPDDAEPDNDDPSRPADYLYIDPTAFVPFENQAGPPGVGINNLNNSFPGLGDLDWNDKVKAVAIRGDFGVLLADDPDYNGVVTCFDNRTGGRLDDYERHRNPLDRKKPFVRWGNKGAQSLKVLKEGLCRAPGITLAEEFDFWAGGIGPAVYFFEVLAQGKDANANIIYKVPIAYCNNLTVCSGPTNFGFPPNPGPAVGEALSLFVVPGESAVRLYEKSPPTAGLNMCFRERIDNLKEYLWDPEAVNSKVSGKIMHIEGTVDSACPEEGKPL